MNAKAKSYRRDRGELLREMLLRLQDGAYQRVRELRRDQEQEALSEPADEADCANVTEEIETHASLIARAEEKLRFLDEALVRLDSGKYGQCVGCTELIPVERLRAIPFAAYCVPCQEKINRTKQGWGTGSMIQPYDHQWSLPEEMEEPASREYRSTATDEQLTVTRGVAAAGGPKARPARKPAAGRRVAKRKK
jgi:DnaK suppressor protein